VEKLLTDVESLQQDTHPDLIRMKKEQAETLRQEFAHLDNYLEHLKRLFEKQMQCEIQAVEEELEDFKESNPP
jgi:LytS/YehU family sensor histidine kinase